jgi:RimJ/RimL family protein N-acetyltransferase
MTGLTTLVGLHVALEPLDARYVPGLVAAANEDREHYRYTDVPITVDEMASYVERALAGAECGTVVPFVVLDARSNAVLGSTRFYDIERWEDHDPAPTVVEIGYSWLAASAQRTAINTEMKYLMLTQAFDGWKVIRVALRTDRRNTRSRIAIERIGGRFEGIRRAHMPGSDGAVRDTAYYSILASEWPEHRAELEARMASGPRAEATNG